MSSFRTIAIAAAVALAGLTGAANAKTVVVNPNLGLKIKLCIPHYETKRIHLWKTNFDLVIRYYVNRFCQKKIVAVYRIPHRHFHLVARAS